MEDSIEIVGRCISLLETLEDINIEIAKKFLAMEISEFKRSKKIHPDYKNKIISLLESKSIDNLKLVLELKDTWLI